MSRIKLIIKVIQFISNTLVWMVHDDHQTVNSLKGLKLINNNKYRININNRHINLDGIWIQFKGLKYKLSIVLGELIQLIE